MDLPASYYGKLDKRNPVVSAFERDMNSFVTLMRRVASSTSLDNGSHAKGIKILVEICKKYKQRLPSKLYQERMLQTADFLFGLKLYQLAFWQGYSLHLLQFNSVKITDVTDVDHFMACFFPEGFDTDQDTFVMKIRAMQGCALCIFEQEKRHSVLRQKGLCKLLHVLNFIRIMMQALQQHEHLCWQIYNGSLLIYTICRYLMTMNCSAQALEYLLWASISLELSISLMTAKYLPWIVTLYCAVCHCYYDNQAAVQAEEFARRALGKINELAKLEEQEGVPATRETQRAYKEASIKLAAMMFKRAVFEARRRPKPMFRIKSNLKDIPNGPWPRSTTERMLMGLFDSSPAQFLGILEALWDSTRRPLQTRMPDEPELQEVILELLSAGISILSGVATTSESLVSLGALTPTSTLVDLAITGENKVPVMSAVRFIKILFQYKQPDTFTELAREMLEVLSGVEGQSFRRAELELALLDRFNSLLSSQRSRPREDNVIDDGHKSSFSMGDEFIDLVDTLHKSVCGSAPEVQPDGDLVLDVVLFLWDKVKLAIQRYPLQTLEFTHYHEKVDDYDKWLWCLSMLCEVAYACDLAAVDGIMTAEMIHTLAVRLESAAEHSNQSRGACEADCEGVKPSSLSLLKSSSTELLQRVCELVDRGLEALSKGLATLLPQDCSAITDSAFMQRFGPLPPSTPSLFSPTSSQEGNEEDEISQKKKEEVKTKAQSDIGASRHTQSSHVFLLATHLHLELDIIHHRAFLKLLRLNAVAEPGLLDRIKKNKVSKALFLMQKASLAYNNMEPNNSNKIESLLEEASTLIKKAAVEERKLYISATPKTPAENKDKGKKEKEEKPPPPPILLSRTDRSLTFSPAPYNLEGQVCWYQLCGRAAEGINRKVRLGDCSLQGTGNMVPAVSGECVLRVEGLEPNQKYVFAVAAYNRQGNLLGNTIGASTFPLLASLPVPLLYTWAHLAQVAFQTKQYAVAKRACRELWIHYTYTDPGSQETQDGLAFTGLRVQTLQCSSPQLCQLFLTSIFIETEINIRQRSLYCDSFSDSGPFVWEQEARLAECERMLVAMDLALWLNDGSAAVQAVVSCYGLLAPLIFHQIACDPVVQVLKKCLIVLEENSGLLKQKWIGNTSESFMHMIACITYYLSKALRVLREHQMASVVMDSGRRLLQEVYDAQLQISRLAAKAVGSKRDHAAIKDKMTISLQLKALHRKNKKRIRSEAALVIEREIACPLIGCEVPSVLYDLISNSTLKDAYHKVMTLRHKVYFIEFAALILQRAMEEGHPDLVLKWGQSMFEVFCRQDEKMGMSTKCLEGNSQSKRRSSAQAPKGNEPPQQNKGTPSHDDTRKTLKQKIAHGMLLGVKSKREKKAVENLLTMMSSVVQRRKKLLQLRTMCCRERVWKSQLNYSMAEAHLALLYQGLDQLHGGALQQSYGQLNPLFFSLAYSGVLVRRNPQRQTSSNYEVVSERDSSHSGLTEYVVAHKERNEKEAVRVDDSVTEESCEEGEISRMVEQQIETHRCTAALLLDSLNKAALHLQRAMMLAHRGSHWTILQCVCQTVWDQSCRITLLVQRAAQHEPPSSITADQLHTTFTPLLVLATDLMMDMLNRLGLWSLYDRELTEEELESSLHFSAPLDNSTQVDLRWVRTLVLHTLERLHDSGKWESLAHFALVFNSYTRERYALIITPLLVNAQRRLLERISSFGGPVVPQPHHVKTKQATGKEVTYRSYADSQLLIGSTAHPAQTPTILRKAALTNSTPRDTVDLKGAEIQHSMSLVCVPLDVEDTLSGYRRALERRPYCLQVFQHSRSLLLQLLAFTKPCFAGQLKNCQNRSLSHSASLVDFSPLVMPVPSIQPCDLTEEDYSNPNALYTLPISPDHMTTVSAAYSTSIQYLQANNQNSLRVLALHEMGNLLFYNGNLRAAHLRWSKAVDCALQSSGAIKKWDGVSFGGGSLQQTLKEVGIWGCLQAAGLTAKIARYILTANISERTKCCLMSAHLFKCVLCCSLAQPQADLQYTNHSIRDELIPGVDLFSEPHRVHLSTTVTSLNFLCHWLFTTGYHITLLPILALYLHFVGSVCRDVQRTVEGKILKIRALTELCLFTEAVKEAVQLTQGTGVLLPHGHYITNDNLQPAKTFYSNKSLLDNSEALEELVNCDFAPEVRSLYGSTLCLRFNFARIQLVLALSSTVHGSPVPDTVERETCASITSCPVNSKPLEQNRLDTEASCLKTEEPKVLTLDVEKEKLTPERIKFLLLEGASSLLHSIFHQLTPQSCSEMENLELSIESNLLKANLYLQQGHSANSSEMAISALVLLQTSPVIMRGIINSSPKPASEILHARTGIQQGSKDCNVSNLLHGDCPRAVEASERIGVSLWLRCRLALVRSLAAQIPGTADVFPGKNINEEAAWVLQEGLDECARWGELDIQALLMVEAAELEAQRGNTDDSMAMLQEAVTMLSGRTCMPPGSSVTLARATLLLSDLRGVQSITLLKLTQKLVKKQLCVFGQSVVLDDGKSCVSPPGPSNIYLPYFNILHQTTLRIGQILDCSSMQMPVSAQSSQSTSRQHSHQSSQIERDSQAPVPSLNNPSTTSSASRPDSAR
ncbi:cilia- and flagella-associated protein 54 [Cebidichthys violaceus]|uniref:cilia- and flagella-associated protein 54 n=1 Tax=Cebidichthys violaceus TaxID=271503 RepID=UPI0035CA0E38